LLLCGAGPPPTPPPTPPAPPAAHAQGENLAGLIEDLEANHPGIRERLLDGEDLRRFVNVYINDEDVRFIGGLEAPLSDGDQVTVLPAVAGG
jgi:molybdopterin converting factor small subunit